MELNITKFNKKILLETTKELSKNNIRIRAMTLALAGIDCTDKKTTIDYEERCAALEGLAEFFIEERKKVIKYLDTLSLDNKGLDLLRNMEESYE